MSDDKLLLLKLLGRDLRDNWPFWQKRFQGSLVKWRNKFLADLTTLVVLGGCVWGGYVVFLYYLQSIWAIFVETPMGNIFTTQVSPEIVAAIVGVLDMELSKVAFECVINILLITVSIGVLLKFSGLYRLAYLNRGFIGNVFWGIICSIASAELLPIVGSAGYLKGNFALYFLPTICLLVGSFGLSAWLVPEFTVIFQFNDFLQERVQIVKIRDLPYPRQEI